MKYFNNATLIVIWKTDEVRGGICNQVRGGAATFATTFCCKSVPAFRNCSTTISIIFRDSRFSRISSLESCLVLELNTKVSSRSRPEFETRRDEILEISNLDGIPKNNYSKKGNFIAFFLQFYFYYCNTYNLITYNLITYNLITYNLLLTLRLF